MRAVCHGEHDLGDNLVRLQRRREQVLEEILGRYRPPVGDDVGVEHQCDGRIVAGRVGVRDDTADRAHVAHLVVADLAGHLGQDGQLVPDDVRAVNREVARERAHVQLVALGLDAVETLDAVDVYEGLGLGEAKPHQRDEAMAARQHLGILSKLAKQLDRLID